MNTIARAIDALNEGLDLLSHAGRGQQDHHYGNAVGGKTLPLPKYFPSVPPGVEIVGLYRAAIPLWL